ncbi:MAG: hypothetical protein CMG00_06510 [Candidatus Marinimicrobia bacterium]|nr:hypothetical protein [Candidatus Neomarinimicrobiota bacterium]|tara:strand:- start:1767 stop:2141 length:375 start_codon:yes stop_codon:yes gene_type:complete
MFNKKPSINVFGKKLESCCDNPKTGFFRNGFCDTCNEDQGIHTVCVMATKEFLEYSKSVGNDLSTPNPQFEFPGVKPGDRWCLCAIRWKEAYDSGMAPPVFLESTHIETLKLIELNILQEYAVN